MKTETLILDEMTATALNSERYEIIENETISNSDYKEISISGSLLSHSKFSQVVFQGCSFFGSSMQACEFIGCQFIDCTFQFTNLDDCEFVSTMFKDCNWEVSNVNFTTFNCCELDNKTLYKVSKGRNSFNNCYTSAQTRVDDAA